MPSHTPEPSARLLLVGLRALIASVSDDPDELLQALSTTRTDATPVADATLTDRRLPVSTRSHRE